jgi:hypothetical protein
MAKRKNPDTSLEKADALARLLEGFDLRVEADDFVLYELSRLIEEDRASFEDEEFRRTIDLGIHAHIEENVETRARMAATLRKAGDAAGVKTIQALENVESPLRGLSLIVRTYITYAFRRLEEIENNSVEAENEARILLQRWQNDALPQNSLAERLLQIGWPAVGALADVLFEAPENRESAETVLQLLGSLRCSSSARVLVHAISEPILPEDLEWKAYNYARALWPLPRHYLLFQLSDHSHEDLPFRWFQLLVECDELTAVDIVLDEMVIHAGTAAYAEDLQTILELLRLSHDPDLEPKVVAMLNSAGTPTDAVRYLQDFLANFRPSPQPVDNAWSRAGRLIALNKRYATAARLLDRGKVTEARQSLDAILREQPGYPYAVQLKEIISSLR